MSFFCFCFLLFFFLFFFSELFSFFLQDKYLTCVSAKLRSGLAVSNYSHFKSLGLNNTYEHTQQPS